ncbi:MAG TPA: dihydropteroate synthase [Bacteroidales bacterium]|jgi:5-methyltetrahydrofolate--homocysteine methyltransferase|nr:dihydropteroate synthase [Bacteroidales bacterium]MBP8710276.1 dihydropteroate synthase [Bacteroidales bacterium]HPH74154.1 dihydropteroate synthase [Bacteroidales bacterium]HQG21587.1 dihydropteroate synthase [Bacteroidales bacterium]HQI11908.1 dihydropteroate synthase [Bacteroidales bacterium]
MKTILKGTSKEVVIDTEGPVVIIGECINPTRRKKLASTLQANDFSYMLELAKSQIDAMADVLDVNVGFPGVVDEELLPRAVIELQERFDIPLCLDSPNPKAIEAALKVARGKCLINSVNAEEASLQRLLPVAREYGAAIIGLVLDDDGITHDPEKRLRIAEKIIERAVRSGIKEEDVIIDPMAMAVSADPNACRVTLETIRLVHDRLGHNITQGASNISFGLPNRENINNAYMAMSIMYGLTCPIANPEKITGLVRAADLVLGRDDYAIRFIEHFQLTQLP